MFGIFLNRISYLNCKCIELKYLKTEIIINTVMISLDLLSQEVILLHTYWEIKFVWVEIATKTIKHMFANKRVAAIKFSVQTQYIFLFQWRYERKANKSLWTKEATLPVLWSCFWSESSKVSLSFWSPFFQRKKVEISKRQGRYQKT